MKQDSRDMIHPETICAHFAEDPQAYHGAVIPPIFQNSLFTFPNFEARASNYQLAPEEVEQAAGGLSHSYDYTRISNPTTDIVERKIAALEGGEAARCFGSGMGAISASILSCMKAGDHAVAPFTTYGPTRSFLEKYLNKFDISVTYVNGTDPTDYQNALRSNTTLLYLESPSSVVMYQQDIEAIAAIARACGASTICDNSWASPIFQNPLSFGVDIVVHSATKYLGGHSDIVAGVAVGGRERMKKLIMEEGFLLGATLDPFASWLLLRGLRTLPIRMERHQQNARIIAERLQQHDKVSHVCYPGLSWDTQSSLTMKQLRGTSGLLSIRLSKPGRESAAIFVNHLKYFSIGVSWGGFESLALPIPVPADWIGGDRGCAAWFVRLHIGLENPEDLWSDIEGALAAIPE